MATRSKLLQVELVDRDAFDARDVAERLGKTLILAINDEGAKLVGTTAVAHLTLASTEAARLVNLQKTILI